MSALRGLRRSISEFAIGIRLNRYDKTQTGGNWKEEGKNVSSILNNLPNNPLKHKTFVKKVQASENLDRGGITLAEAIKERQI